MWGKFGFWVWMYPSFALGGVNENCGLLMGYA